MKVDAACQLVICRNKRIFRFGQLQHNVNARCYFFTSFFRIMVPYFLSRSSIRSLPCCSNVPLGKTRPPWQRRLQGTKSSRWLTSSHRYTWRKSNGRVENKPRGCLWCKPQELRTWISRPLSSQSHTMKNVAVLKSWLFSLHWQKRSSAVSF